MAPIPCTTLKKRSTALEGMANDASYRYRDRDDERACTFSDIRHHPMATHDTVAHILKRMWDMEEKDDDNAWLDLREHLGRMLEQARKHLRDPHVASVHAEWCHERDGGTRARGGKAVEDETA